MNRMRSLAERRNCPNILAAMALLAVPLLLAGPVGAEETDDRLAAFKLYTNCEPFDLRVGGLHPEAGNIGLSREAIVAAVESRLGAAGLFDPESDTYLFTNVNLTSEAFDIIFAFKKQLYDEYSGETRPATTWATGATGTHGGSPDNILASYDSFMEEFLAEFQQVNAEACSQR